MRFEAPVPHGVAAAPGGGAAGGGARGAAGDAAVLGEELQKCGRGADRIRGTKR